MLQVHELKKAYGDRLAVNGLSLRVNRGEIVGLLGPNGAGKSTTVSMIAGLASPSEGRVTLDGLPVQESGVRRRIGLAPQELSLYDKLSAHENLSFLAALHGMRGDAAREAIDRVLEDIGGQRENGPPVPRGAGGGAGFGHRIALSEQAVVIGQHRFIGGFGAGYLAQDGHVGLLSCLQICGTWQRGRNRNIRRAG